MPGWPLHLLQMILVAVVMIAPVPLALALVRRLGSDRHGALDNVLATIVFVVSSQVGLGLILGFFGLFTPGMLVVAELVVLGVGIGLARRTGIPAVLPRQPLDAVESGALLVVMIAAGLGLADLVVHPTRNFDSLAYHLPVMARWVSADRLEVFAALGQIALYPSHFELLSAMLQLPLGQDLLISAPNLLVWAQLGLAIVLVSRRLGATRRASFVAASLVLLLPSILSRLDAIQPDIALAGVFLTALGFALRREEEGRALDLSVILLSIGLLAGLKLSGPVFVLMLIPVVLAGPELRRLRPVEMARRLDPGSARAFVVGIGVFAVALALAWYLRNWIALGNPFGDLQIEVLGARLFDGSITREELQRGALSNVFRIGAGEDWGVLGRVLWEWLGAGAALLVIAAVLAIRGPAETRRARILILALLVLCIALYWRTPYSGDNGTHGWRVSPWIEVGLRYVFPGIGLLGVLAAVGMSRGRWWTWVGLAVLVVTSVLTVLEQLLPHVVVLILVVVVAWAIAMIAQGRTIPRPGLAAATVVVLALVVIGLGLARERRETQRAIGFGKIVGVLATELTADDVVAVVNSQKLHVAAGMDWKRRVELPQLPPAGQEVRWVNTLRSRGITALLIGHQQPAPGQEDAVARVQQFIRRSGRFELIEDYESRAKDLALFRLKR